MNCSDKNSRWPASAIIAVLLVTVSCLFAVREGKAAPPQPRAAKKKAKTAGNTKEKAATRHSASSKTVKAGSSRPTKSGMRYAKSRRRLPHSSRARLAMLHLDPSRVEEIQQALIREGALNGSPTGTWDDSTKSAMRQYQSANGFAATGLPDARSLMKLGLGPHPLPADVAAAAAGTSNIDGQIKIDALEHPAPNH